MKVIDLLNKIANGENTPDKFIYDGMLFERHLDNYYQHYDIGKTCSNIVQFTDEICSDYSNLNDEVEIIEDTPKEDKKIEKLDLSDWWEITSAEDCKPEKLAIIFNKNAKAFSSKINELIDKVSGK